MVAYAASSGLTPVGRSALAAASCLRSGCRRSPRCRRRARGLPVP
jgi:hypothetical protein